MIDIITKLLPVILKLLGVFLDKMDANAQTKAKFKELTKQMAEDGLITVKSHNKFKEMWAEIDEELKEKP